MTDKYIDVDETQIYGPYAAAQIEKLVVGISPDFDAGLKKLAGELVHATSEVLAATKAARGASAGVRAGARDKGPLLAQGLAFLGRFSTHLDAHPAGTVDRKTFFAEDGTAHGVGSAAPRVLLAIGRIARELEKPECTIRDKGTWLAEAQALSARLAPAIAHADDARTERAGATPDLEATRQAWLTVYKAAKLCVEGVLVYTGKLHLLSTVFHDLAVPGNAKVTAPPAPANGPAPSA